MRQTLLLALFMVTCGCYLQVPSSDVPCPLLDSTQGRKVRTLKHKEVPAKLLRKEFVAVQLSSNRCAEGFLFEASETTLRLRIRTVHPVDATAIGKELSVPLSEVVALRFREDAKQGETIGSLLGLVVGGAIGGLISSQDGDPLPAILGAVGGTAAGGYVGGRLAGKNVTVRVSP